jgi:hypothetical protein
MISSSAFAMRVDSLANNAKLCAVMYEHNDYHGASLIISDANA